jgi:serine/threonine protein kinase
VDDVDDVEVENKAVYREGLIFLSKLGRGQSSTVYKAVDLLDLRIVAVKKIQMKDRFF